MGKNLSRRDALQLMGFTGLSMISEPVSPLFSYNKAMLRRPIPSSGEQLPVVGLGTWIQFDAGESQSERVPLLQVLKNMNGIGGKVIDSSPMYGRSESVIGDLSTQLNKSDQFFYATKVWTQGREDGIEQMHASMKKMRRKTIDLMQVHNLIDWQTHLKTLRQWKEQGKIRYIGITHYIDSSHDELERIINSEKPDFVQFNYSIRNRHAEQRLLNVARDRGTAVIINQPFESGNLFNAIRGKPLPPWASEYAINYWAQYFLKYLISNPAVNIVIPGTSDPMHIIENMQAAYEPLPDEKGRKKLIEYFEK